MTVGCSRIDTVREILHEASKGADISIIEGVMGFFDGKSPLANTGSTAEISIITESPVLLVVNCASMARSAAAIVKGFQTFQGPNIVGVIANQVEVKAIIKLSKQPLSKNAMSGDGIFEKGTGY